jgi:23S rRNA pseudouridine1911/1915/1917 synthase
MIVTEQDLEARLDKLLAAHYPGHSRTYFQYLIKNGFVLVNGKQLKKKDKPKPGDEIDVCFQLTPEISLEPENIPLNIVYEDDHILVINKPAGMVVHPAPGHPRGTFVHALLYHCKGLPFADKLRPGIVHRLDKETSGLLLAAKTLEAHQKLIALFSERKMKKTYLAICIGNPGEGTISAPLKRHKTRRQEMAVDPEGKEAVSRIKTLKTEGALALVEIELVTGRTHQIRVHMKHRGTPVLGDPVYGSLSANKKYGAVRQLLHAHRLEFIHPITGIGLKFVAPLPDDFCFS